MADHHKLLQQGSRITRFLGRSRNACRGASSPPTPRGGMDTPLARPPAWRRYAQEVTTSEYKSRVREPMERMKIGHRARHMPQHLSVGQHQRAAIARAVLSRPQLILADE